MMSQFPLFPCFLANSNLNSGRLDYFAYLRMTVKWNLCGVLFRLTSILCHWSWNSTRVILSFFFLQGKWDVPLPKVKAVGENEVFKVVRTGKTRSKQCLCQPLSQALFLFIMEQRSKKKGLGKKMILYPLSSKKTGTICHCTRPHDWMKPTWSSHVDQKHA